MKNTIREILLFFSILSQFFFYTPLKAQQSPLDSLIRLANNYKSKCKETCIEDSIKVKLLDNISWELKSFNLDSALLLANQSLELAQKIKYKKGEARGFTQKSICLRYLGKYDEALIACQNSLKIWDELLSENEKSLEYKRGKIKALFQISSNYSGKGNYLESIKAGEISLSLAKEINDKRLMGGQIGNLGGTYQALGDYSKAIEYYFQSLKLTEEMGEKRSVAINYNLIGYLFSFQKEYEKALEYLQKGLKVSIEIGDKQLSGDIYYSIASTYNQSQNFQLGIENAMQALKISQEVNYRLLECNSWMELCNLYTAIGDYNKAIESGNLALKIASETENLGLKAAALNSLANCKRLMKNYKDSELDLLQAIQIGKEIQSPGSVQNSEEILSVLYTILGKHDKALIHYKNFIKLRDSLENEESNRKQIRSEINFEFDKKTAVLQEAQEKEKQIAEEKSFIQKIIISGVALVLVIVLFFTYMIFKSLKTTKKQKQIIELKEQETNEQNIIIKHQKHLVEEKQKEILDSINYAKRIQYTLLAHSDFLKDNIPNHFVYFNPKDIVSGDFYWATKRGNKFYLAVCDSTGHGVPGAL